MAFRRSEPVPGAVFHGGVIYTSRGYRSSPFMAIRPGGKGNIDGGATCRGASPSGAPYISSLVHYDGLIYMMGDVGVLTVTDAKTGERVFQERVGGVYTASPVAGDGKVYFVSEDGETIVARRGPDATRVLERNPPQRQAARLAGNRCRAPLHPIRRRVLRRREIKGSRLVRGRAHCRCDGYDKADNPMSYFRSRT